MIEDWGRKYLLKNKWTILHCDPKKLVKAKYRNLNLKNRPLQKMNFCLKTISLFATSLLWYQERQIYFYIKATVSVISSDPLCFFVASLMDLNTICSRLKCWKVVIFGVMGGTVQCSPRLNLDKLWYKIYCLGDFLYDEVPAPPGLDTLDVPGSSVQITERTLHQVQVRT